MKKGGDPEHPSKLHFLSFMVMELLGPSVGHLSLELQTYTQNLKLLVNHGLGMLKVSTSCRKCSILAPHLPSRLLLHSACRPCSTACLG